MDRAIRLSGLQETQGTHNAVHFLNPAYYVISVVIYFVFKLLLFLFIGSEEHGCLLPILKTSSIGMEGNGGN